MKKDGVGCSFVPPRKSGAAVVVEAVGEALSKLLGRGKPPGERVKEIRDGVVRYNKSKKDK